MTMKKDSTFWDKSAYISSKFLEAILVFGVLLMLGLIFINVVLRYGFNTGITVSEELARIFFVWIIFIGSVLALRRKQHLGVNMLVDKLPIKTLKILHIFRQIVLLGILSLIALGGWEDVKVGLDVYLPVTGLPQIVFSGVVLISAIGMVMVIIVDLISAIFSPSKIENKDKFLTSITLVEDLKD